MCCYRHFLAAETEEFSEEHRASVILARFDKVLAHLSKIFLFAHHGSGFLHCFCIF